MRRASWLMTVTISASLGWIAGVMGPPMAFAQPIYDHLTLFAEVLGHVQHRYVDEIEEDVLVEAAIEGMLAELDPHSVYMNPEEYEAMKNDTRGEYVGVGIVIAQEGDGVIVREVFPGGPADLAGVLVNDQILSVNDTSMQPAETSDVVSVLRGRRGEAVSVTVGRPGEDGATEELAIEIVRDMIHMEAVVTSQPVPGYGVVRVRQFQSNVSDDVRGAIDRLQSDYGDTLQGIVLDLRGNPGGLLSEAIALSDVFMSEGEIVSTGGRAEAPNNWTARRGTTRYAGPVVLLMDAGSASASEIVAGALQDTGRANVVGTQSYGKGSVQSIIDLTGGSGLKLTISRYYTPSGRSISGEGITPDWEVAPGQAVNAPEPLAALDDAQLQAGLRWLMEPAVVEAELAAPLAAAAE